MERDFDPVDCDIKLVADPSQGSDIERMARAEAILMEAKQDQSGIINKRDAYERYFEQLGAQNIERLVPPPSNEPDPMTQLMLKQQQVEADLRQRDQRLREQEQELKAAKLNLEQQESLMRAFKEAQELGMDVEESQSKITLNYANALEKLSGIQATNLDAIRQIEEEFIGDSSLTTTEGGSNVTRADIQASPARPNRPMVE